MRTWLSNVIERWERGAPNGDYDGPERRGHSWLWTAHQAFRDLAPVIAVGIAAIAVFGNEGKADRADLAASRAELKAARAEFKANQNMTQIQIQNQGRAVAIDVLCGGIAGVETAGRKILTDTLPLPPGIPRQPRSRRERRINRSYARAYARVISDAVVSQIKSPRFDPKTVLRRDGTIDCDELRVQARARP